MSQSRLAFIAIASVLMASALGQPNITYKDLHDFGGTVTNANGTSGPDGNQPNASVTFDSAGNAYGTASVGGPFGSNLTGGNVWRISTGGAYTDLWDFSSSAYQPGSPISFDSKGNMWGTFDRGSADLYGGIWSIQGSSLLTSYLYQPVAGVTFNAGVAYGTDRAGGVYELGSVWQLYNIGSVVGLEHSFGGTAANGGAITNANGNTGPDGTYPWSGVTFDSSGNMYGTTTGGGANGAGMVWEFTTKRKYIDLHDFGGTVTNANGKSGPDGSTPIGGVTVDAAGNLYGTAENGGPNGGYGGVVWEIATSGVYKDLHDFGGTVTIANGTRGPDGTQPFGGVTFDSFGNIYGTTLRGGPNGENGGIVWVITAAGPYIDLHDFGGTVTNANGTSGADGNNPVAGVTLNSSGVLYGTTFSGGPNGQGTVWSLDWTLYTGVIKSLTIAPNSIVGGNTALGTLTLKDPAPAGGASVSVVSNNSCATVLGEVAVPPGATTATFPISTIGVNSETAAAITAGLANNSASASITVNPSTFLSLTLNPTSVVGGNSSTGTLTLTGQAGPGGAVVNLTSTEGTATVPATCTIPAGKVTASFTIPTTGVDSEVGSIISAKYGGTFQNQKLTITPAQLDFVTLTPTTVVGGNSATGTVALTGQAGPSGIPVTLGSNSQFATVPASTKVAAGQASATFTIATTGVGATTNATITVQVNTTKAPAILTITPAQLKSLQLNPTSVVGGNSSTGTVTLTGQAGPSGTVVTLASTGAASVPASTTVAAGQTSGTFTISTSGVTSSTSSTITATFNGQSQSQTLGITAAQLATLTLNPTSVVGGVSSTGSVTLTGQAGPGGAFIDLFSSSEPATLLGSMTIPSGQSSGTFQISTGGVNAVTTSTITAAYSSVSISTPLTILPAPIIAVILNPTSVVGGNNSTGTAVLGGSAGPGGITIALSSSSGAASVPATILISAGQTYATFSVSTSGVGAQTNATVSAKLNGQSQSAQLTINPAQFLSLSLNPYTVTGGTASTGTLTLTGAAPPGGVVVGLVSSSTSAGVPKTVTVPAGQSSTSFTITTVPVAAQASAVITAANGGDSDYAILIIAAAVPASVTFVPSSVLGGLSSEGTVTLTGPAPKGGLTIALKSDSKSATVPASVRIAAGDTSATFKVDTVGGTSQQSATITASTKGGSADGTLTILPISLVSVSVGPNPVVGGKEATGTVTLSAPAPVGGLSVTLSSQVDGVSVPTKVIIDAGRTTATFTVKTTTVTSKATGTITASLASVSVTCDLVVNP